MAITIIPLQQGVAYYRVNTQLLGVSYLLDFYWNAYAESWWLSVYDAQEHPIRTGIRCVLGTFLARTAQLPPFNQGALVCVDTSGQALDPGFNDFGSRVKLAFMEMLDIIAYEQNPQLFVGPSARGIT